MKTIYKYPFPTIDAFQLDLPVGAEILCVQTQDETPCIWALVDPDAHKEIRSFLVYGTGHLVTGSAVKEYRGTYQLQGGILVFHLFEVIKEK